MSLVPPRLAVDMVDMPPCIKCGKRAGFLVYQYAEARLISTASFNGEEFILAEPPQSVEVRRELDANRLCANPECNAVYNREGYLFPDSMVEGVNVKFD